MDEDDFEAIEFFSRDFLNRIKRNLVFGSDKMLKCEGVLHCCQKGHLTVVLDCKDVLPLNWNHKRVKVWMEVIG